MSIFSAINSFDQGLGLASILFVLARSRFLFCWKLVFFSFVRSSGILIIYVDGWIKSRYRKRQDSQGSWDRQLYNVGPGGRGGYLSREYADIGRVPFVQGIVF